MIKSKEFKWGTKKIHRVGIICKENRHQMQKCKQIHRDQIKDEEVRLCRKIGSSVNKMDDIWEDKFAIQTTDLIREGQIKVTVIQKKQIKNEKS